MLSAGFGEIWGSPVEGQEAQNMRSASGRAEEVSFPGLGGFLEWAWPQVRSSMGGIGALGEKNLHIQRHQSGGQKQLAFPGLETRGIGGMVTLRHGDEVTRWP